MSTKSGDIELDVGGQGACSGCCSNTQPQSVLSLSRRRFMQGLGVAGAGMGKLAMTDTPVWAANAEPIPADQPFPRGAALRVKPILVFDVPTRRDKSSWRNYGAIQTPEAVRNEAVRIEKELRLLQQTAEFPIQVQAVERLDSEAKLGKVNVDNVDLCLVYAAGYVTQWPLKVPMVMFVRHRSGPFYLGFEIAHWRFLRGNGDELARPDYDTDDVVVDSCDELLWRLRAMYGLKNARGTRMLTIGGLTAYSAPAQQNGPRVAKEVWGYDFVNVTNEEFTKRLGAARADQQVAKRIEAQTAALINLPNLKLETEGKFVFNSYMALHVVRQFLQETGASNFGFAQCMGHAQITMLDTPACLVLSLANDEGYTAYCHTDLSHTMPGVLLRWIASRPAFVCNSHVPHDGLYFVAHCQAPRRMNGRDFEPATIMTHYESEYGAAPKVEMPIGQEVTFLDPEYSTGRWLGFKGKVKRNPYYEICRSQQDVEIIGNWKKLKNEVRDSHWVMVYGDYLKEAGYAARKLGLKWENFSDTST